jgi:phosphatidylglycerol:prolipoprotein diacylglycerol transferase
VLGAAEAELGNFDKAVSSAQQAAALAGISRDQTVQIRLPEIRARLEEYSEGRSHTEPRFVQAFPQSLPVRGYGLLMCLGFLAGGITAILLARQVGIAPDVVWDLGIYALLGGIIGARAFYLVQYHDRVFEGKSGIDLLLVPFQLQEGGLVLLGGLIFGSVIFLAYARYRKLKPLLMADIALPGFFVALAFGRLGCLMNGCCYGDRCELPWALEFPLGSVPDMALVIRGFIAPESLASLPLHPTQIYSSLDALILAFLTIAYFQFRSRDGEVLALGMLTYPITRFSIEFLRGDEMGKFGTGLTISQLVSLGIFFAGLGFAYWLSQRPRQTASGKPASDRIASESAKTPASSVGRA